MTTTLNQIRSHSPCTEGWAKLLKHLNKTTADDEPLSLLTVLDSNGIDDAVWCLCTEATPERIHRFALAIARRVEHLSLVAKACNDVTERYLNGTANKAELDVAHTATRLAACVEVAVFYAAECAAAHADHVAACAASAASAAYVVACAASAETHAANAANAAVYAANAANAAVYAATHAAEREAQAQIFKEIFA
jgi:hypothetical protein